MHRKQSYSVDLFCEGTNSRILSKIYKTEKLKAYIPLDWTDSATFDDHARETFPIFSATVSDARLVYVNEWLHPDRMHPGYSIDSISAGRNRDRNRTDRRRRFVVLH